MTIDNPRDFEAVALNLARAIHDPLHLQGAVNLLGRERDGIFIDSDSVHVYEFTTDRKKEKARKDGAKISEALDHLARLPENRYKSLSGWFVTQHEPTADQREAIRDTAKGRTIHALSSASLRARLCDATNYISHRDACPFGSTAYTKEAGASVPPMIRDETGASLSVSDISRSLLEGERHILTGEFGVGKSHTLRLVYRELRREYISGRQISHFPIHINLRECAGTKSAGELLRRHAEDIGFGGARGLVSAWRAGACVLLLDGFDEVIPARWLGAARSLRDVRREALAPLRQLIQEAGEGTGIITAGRAHYFSSGEEMASSLGFDTLSPSQDLQLGSFNAEQAATFLRSAGENLTLPEWLPTRPLLLSHLLAQGLLLDVAGLAPTVDAARGWKLLLEMLCERESRIYSAVDATTIRRVMKALATRARTKGDGTATLTRQDLADVYFAVSGVATDEESNQLLLRLPGLAAASEGDPDSRVFSDDALSMAAYGEDLADYISSPYQGHALAQPAAWVTAARNLAINVCTITLADVGISPGQISAAASHRMNGGLFDVILYDILAVLEDGDVQPGLDGYIIEGIHCEQLTPTADGLTPNLHMRHCLIDVLDMSTTGDPEALPTIQDCIIGELIGSPQHIKVACEAFSNTEVVKSTPVSETTAGILSLEIAPLDRVILSILHKVYAKRGSGRKESAFPRGLDPVLRGFVPEAIQALLTSGYLQSVTRGSNTIYPPIRDRTARVKAILAAPNAFSIDGL